MSRCSWNLSIWSPGAHSGLAANALPLLSEVFYDAVGSDDGLSFVELYGARPYEISVEVPRACKFTFTCAPSSGKSVSQS